MAVGAPPSEGEALKHMELALAFELMSRVTMQDLESSNFMQYNRNEKYEKVKGSHGTGGNQNVNA